MSDPCRFPDTGLSTEIVYSPDDGGYWISQFNWKTEKSRASVKIYHNHAEAQRMLADNKVRWERWS